MCLSNRIRLLENQNECKKRAVFLVYNDFIASNIGSLRHTRVHRGSAKHTTCGKSVFNASIFIYQCRIRSVKTATSRDTCVEKLFCTSNDWMSLHSSARSVITIRSQTESRKETQLCYVKSGI